MATLYDKIWADHLVGERADGQQILYIDQQLLHEVTSPQAFEGLRLAGREPWRLAANLATPDHNVPTEGRDLGLSGIDDSVALEQVVTLDDNCKRYGIRQFDILDVRQGIVHVVGPEQGVTLPGMTIVCGDSHTSTHGAFAALAQGIGTSEVEHVLATQCLVQRKMRNMAVRCSGALAAGVSAKDLILKIIGDLGTDGATGHTIEYLGEAISALSMEGRMTVCNMSIEAGARAGLVAVDDVTLEYVQGRPFAPVGALWDEAQAHWRTLHSDADARFDVEYQLDASSVAPQVSWGTSPEMVVGVDETTPDSVSSGDPHQADSIRRALEYMGLAPGQPITDIQLDRVFIGSCTNARIEDLRDAAAVLRGREVAGNVKQAMVVPGSGLVKAQAEEEGLVEVFTAAGFQWRDPGCSMCLAMNPDKLLPGEHCASTSNRNFEGRQGHGGRTHLVSPAMAAAAAVRGHFADVRDML
ncbi:MAG: 3-isopropylmalate dehydratase large subunit [Pseudomonadales bacterium]|nr:3-isopropylmalate dehydratase large subunit [Pseudomonadales bacterium]MDP6826091.1 3-isopropylmalate dehydratase large subunit [Pseudomonadales bacterium]MDP6970376.1 3-isopropylmalate dehydratase large subunit [Pseudomonadales bacterium]